MAIDPAVFAAEFTLLKERFNRRDLTSETSARYLDFLDARMSTAEFQAAAREIFNRDTFWPAPQRFLDAARGGAVRELAERDWTRALHLARRGIYPDYDALPPAVAAAFQVVPMARIMAADEVYEQPRLKRDWLAAYTAAVGEEEERRAAAIGALEASRALPPAPHEIEAAAGEGEA